MSNVESRKKAAFKHETFPAINIVMSQGVKMTLVNKLVILLIISFAVGCSFQTKDMQLIEIKVLDNLEDNDLVAQELMFYSPEYFIHNIPSLNKQNYSGVQTGYVRSSDTGASNFRVFYVLNNISTSEVADIKEEFEKFIPALAEQHASKFNLFRKESESKSKWLQSFINEDNELNFKNFSPSVMSQFEAQLRSIPQQVRNSFGNITEVKYLRGQYYKPFNNLQEQVVLNYQVKMEGNHLALVTIAIDSQSDILSVGFRPIVT
jgi:hypothetical protein